MYLWKLRCFLGIFLVLFLGESPQIFAQNCPGLDVNAGPDITVCGPSGNANLMGIVNGNYLTAEWSPATGLSDPFDLNAIATVNQTTTYTLTGSIQDNTNLITNGDFEAGNSGFSSSYIYVPFTDPIGLVSSGSYSIAVSPSLVLSTFPPCDDHTFGDGTGNMMILNGDGSVGSTLWCQTISVTPNAVYSLSAWAASITPFSPPQLQFSVNGTLVGNVFNSSGGICGWEPFDATWNSGNAVTAEICITNQNSSGGLLGNNFMLDDIEVYGSCSETDNVTITLLEANIDIQPFPIIDCNSDNHCITIDASLSTSGANVIYNWSPISGGMIASGQGTPIISVCQAGQYQLELINADPASGLSCSAAIQFDVMDNGLTPGTPIFSGPDEACLTDQVTLSVLEQPGYENYTWTHAPDINIIIGQGFSSITLESSAVGDQLICLDVENVCGYSAQNCHIINFADGPTPVQILGDSTSCILDTASLYFSEPLSDFDNIVWSADPEISLISGANLAEISAVFLDTGTYNVCVEVGNLCGTTQSCIAIEQSDPDTFIFEKYTCNLDSIGWDTLLFGGDLGCDTLYLTETIYEILDTVQITNFTCDSDSAGIFTSSLFTDDGCDSTTILTIELVDIDTSYLTDTTCDPLLAGEFVTIIPGTPCDEVQITTVTLMMSDTIQLMDTSCDPQAVGIFEYNDFNTNGCDSTTFVTVSLVGQDTSYLTDTTCDPLLAGEFVTIIPGTPCDEVQITTVTLIMTDTVQLMDTSCDPQAVGIFEYNDFNTDGCDSTTFVTVSLVGQDTSYLTDTTCDPLLAGEFVNIIPGTPCDEVQITTVTLMMSDTVQLMDTSCDPTNVGVFEFPDFNTNGCDSLTILTITLIPPDTTYFSESTCDAAAVGTFQSLVEGPICDEIQILEVFYDPDLCTFEIETIINPVQCNPAFGSINIDILSGTAPFSISWSSMTSGLNGSATLPAIGNIIIDQLLEGSYEFIIIDANGIEQDYSYDLTPVDLPIVQGSSFDQYNGASLSCAGASDAELVAEIIYATSILELTWYDASGIVDPSWAVPAGTYWIELLDMNGCISTDTVVVTPPELIGADLLIESTSCPEANNGSIEILSSYGGLGEISFALNDTIFSPQENFENLSSGTYNIYLEDEFGCRNDTMIQIGMGAGPVLTLGGDETILSGDSILVTPIHNFNIDELATIVWSPMICDSCLITFVQPTRDQVYHLTMTDKNGCEATDEIEIRVKENKGVFIPNAISPNDDGINDQFEIFLANVLDEILVIRIFDRWGALIFESDGSLNWDGRLRGQPLDPAVFVYQVEVQFHDGQKRTFTGDLTLLR